jgi:hypothetical protein
MGADHNAVRHAGSAAGAGDPEYDAGRALAVRRALVRRDVHTVRHSAVRMRSATVAQAPEECQREQTFHCALHVRYLSVGFDEPP